MSGYRDLPPLAPQMGPKVILAFQIQVMSELYFCWESEAVWEGFDALNGLQIMVFRKAIHGVGWFTPLMCVKAGSSRFSPCLFNFVDCQFDCKNLCVLKILREIV